MNSDCDRGSSKVSVFFFSKVWRFNVFNLVSQFSKKYIQVYTEGVFME